MRLLLVVGREFGFKLRGLSGHLKIAWHEARNDTTRSHDVTITVTLPWRARAAACFWKWLCRLWLTQLHLRFYSLHFHHSISSLVWEYNQNLVNSKVDDFDLYPFFFRPGNGPFFKRVAEALLNWHSSCWNLNFQFHFCCYGLKYEQYIIYCYTGPFFYYIWYNVIWNFLFLLIFLLLFIWLKIIKAFILGGKWAIRQNLYIGENFIPNLFEFWRWINTYRTSIWWISPTEIYFWHKKTHMKWARNCKGEFLNRKRCILAATAPSRIQEHSFEKIQWKLLHTSSKNLAFQSNNHHKSGLEVL